MKAMKKLSVLAIVLFSSVIVNNIAFAGEKTSPDSSAYQLIQKAVKDYESGQLELAKTESEKLLSDAPALKGQWVYGNMIHKGHLILGRIALRHGDAEEAKRHLLEAGKTPGSPQLNSFGPNMSLAKELLEKGEKQVVLDYFDLCRKFWEVKTKPKELDEWTQEVRNGKVPNFGANLNY